MVKTYINIIFDFDGTLVDTAPDIINCLKQSFEEVLQVDNIKIDRNIIGPPVSIMIKQLKPSLDNERVEVLTNTFRVCYDNSVFSDTCLYEGVAELLQILKNDGYKLFIVTNKPLLPTRRILKKLKIDFFDKIVTADILEKKKLTKSEMINFLIKECCLKANESLMIGDTKNDIEAAKKNDIKSVAILNGYGTKAEILSAKPDYIFQSIRDLSAIIHYR